MRGGRRTSSRKGLQHEEKENEVPMPSVTRGPVDTGRRAGNFDPQFEELESKYNVEGLNTIDIVYTRQENDATQRE